MHENKGAAKGWGAGMGDWRKRKEQENAGDTRHFL